MQSGPWVSFGVQRLWKASRSLDDTHLVITGAALKCVETTRICAGLGQSQHVGPKSTPMSHKVFVSYAHSDKKHLDRLRVHLKPLERAGAIDLWADTRIQASDRWRDEIASALSEAEVAILLISADFLASQFIADNELPPLLAAASAKGVVILPIIIGACRFAKTNELSCFQAINDPKQLIGVLPVAEREKFWVKVSDAVEAALVKQPISDGWIVSNANSVSSALNEVLNSGEDNFLVVTSEPYYVQFMVESQVLVMEAVSNRYLPKGSKLSLEDQERLNALGLSTPKHTDANFDLRISVNDAMNQVREIAELAVSIFRDIYKVSSDSKLVFTTL